MSIINFAESDILCHVLYSRLLHVFYIDQNISTVYSGINNNTYVELYVTNYYKHRWYTTVNSRINI